jgi:hypothetical protein
VVPQSIPPILTQSGADFEHRVQDGVNGQFVNHVLNDVVQPRTGDITDNDLVIQHARDLPARETVILFQPRLRATIDVVAGAGG